VAPLQAAVGERLQFPVQSVPPDNKYEETEVAAVIKISLPKNRLYIMLEGYFQEDEAKVAADQVILEAKKLRSGFGLVSEISHFKPASPQAAEHILRAQRAMKELGVQVEWRTYPMPHSVHPQEVRDLGDWMEARFAHR